MSVFDINCVEKELFKDTAQIATVHCVGELSFLDIYACFGPLYKWFLF